MSSTNQLPPFDYSHVCLTTSPLIRILELDPYGSAGPAAPLKGCLRLRRFEPPGRTDISWHIPRFEALSYVWGDQSDPEEITVYTSSGPFWSKSKNNFGVLRIGKNLAAALRRLRLKSRKRALWCDSICINQNDLAEREREVQRMAHLYLHVEKVVAWLGPEADDSQLALEKLALTGNQIVSQGWDDGDATWSTTSKSDERYTRPDVEFPFSPREWRAIEKLIDRPWFKRLWVRQEIALASSATVLCGNAEISWPLLRNATICLVQKIPRPQIDRDCLAGYEANLQNLNSLIHSSATMSDTDVIALTRDSLCMDDRDRVYGVLGILAKYNDHTLVSANYRLSIKEVYKDFVVAYSRLYGNLSFLQFCEMATQPSWVPDLQNLKDRPYPLTSYSSDFSIGTLKVLEGDKVLVSGVLCDTIQTSFSPLPLSSSIASVKDSVATVLSEMLSYKTFPTEDILYEKIIGVLLPYELDTIVSMSEVKAFFKSWQKGSSDSEHELSSPEDILRRIHSKMRGRSCHLTAKGSVVLGPAMAQNGDNIYVLPGCDVPLVLRQVEETAYRIIGTCYHPEYADREAFLGKLPTGWKALSGGSVQWYINHEQNIETLHDPRLGPLPRGWKEKKFSDGSLGWISDDYDHTDLINFDPRLEVDALKARGVLFQQITLV
ncbi:heterokaryon incompatibility protein-domain-containing protein [Hypoxylon sp. NC1633]|nr:heterokaryon incompatibility protein-domain-containing protein [Hypoxylon sp. NC1633]